MTWQACGLQDSAYWSQPSAGLNRALALLGMRRVWMACWTLAWMLLDHLTQFPSAPCGQDSAARCPTAPTAPVSLLCCSPAPNVQQVLQAPEFQPRQSDLCNSLAVKGCGWNRFELPAAACGTQSGPAPSTWPPFGPAHPLADLSMN